jgi:predicted amidohydrolase
LPEIFTAGLACPRAYSFGPAECGSPEDFIQQYLQIRRPKAVLFRYLVYIAGGIFTREKAKYVDKK